MTSKENSVLLVEDHPLLRAGLHQLIERIPGFRLIGEASNGAEARALWEHTKPAMVILDLQLPDCHGLEFLGEMRECSPNTKVIVVSSDSTATNIQAALNAGVQGYFIKTEPIAELQRALYEVAAGRMYLSPSIVGHALGRQDGTPGIPSFTILSPREREVLRLLALGQRTKEIALQLGVSVKTAETFRRRLSTKLKLSSVADLTRYAIRQGIIKA